MSLDATVSAAKHSFRENILFTHRGLSGPAILQISNYWKKSEPISINLTAGKDVTALIQQNRGRSQKTANFLAELLPQRFIEQFVDDGLSNKPLNGLSDRDIERLATNLSDWRVKFSVTEGWDRAEVTLGGVSTKELSSQTMESKKVPGLYFIGEVIDVTGWLGGYNFQWAWASGHAAGSSI